MPDFCNSQVAFDILVLCKTNGTVRRTWVEQTNRLRFRNLIDYVDETDQTITANKWDLFLYAHYPLIDRR